MIGAGKHSREERQLYLLVLELIGVDVGAVHKAKNGDVTKVGTLSPSRLLKRFQPQVRRMNDEKGLVKVRISEPEYHSRK